MLSAPCSPLPAPKFLKTRSLVHLTNRPLGKHKLRNQCKVGALGDPGRFIVSTTNRRTGVIHFHV